MKTFKIYSSETVRYETFVEAENIEEALSKVSNGILSDKHDGDVALSDEVERHGHEVDDIKEVTL